MNESAITHNDGAPAQVLVVDDARPVRQLFEKWLQDAGYRCHVAKNVVEATGVLACEPIDLVTADINMPGESGVEWLPRLRAEFPDLPILMLTGSTDTRLAIRALTQGAWGYLLKPFSRAELLIQIVRALERRRMLIALRDYTRVPHNTVHAQTHMLWRSHEETIERLIAAAIVHDNETGECGEDRRHGAFSTAISPGVGVEAPSLAAGDTTQETAQPKPVGVSFG